MSNTPPYFQYVHEVGHSNAMIPPTRRTAPAMGGARAANMRLNSLRCSVIFATAHMLNLRVTDTRVGEPQRDMGAKTKTSTAE